MCNSMDIVRQSREKVTCFRYSSARGAEKISKVKISKVACFQIDSMQLELSTIFFQDVARFSCSLLFPLFPGQASCENSAV